MIGLRGVCKRFGDLTVLDRFDLDLPPGRVVALMGPNGSGKSTVINLLLGFLVPDAGEVGGTAGLRAAVVFQEDRLCERLTATANVRLALRAPTAQDDLLREFERVGLDRASALKPVAVLSGGQRRRVAIVRAMLARGDFVCLDEPFRGLDEPARENLMGYVEEHLGGRPTLLVTHDPHEAARFDALVRRLPARPAVG